MDVWMDRLLVPYTHTHTHTHTHTWLFSVYGQFQLDIFLWTFMKWPRHGGRATAPRFTRHTASISTQAFLMPRGSYVAAEGRAARRASLAAALPHSQELHPFSYRHGQLTCLHGFPSSRKHHHFNKRREDSLLLPGFLTTLAAPRIHCLDAATTVQGAHVPALI